MNRLSLFWLALLPIQLYLADYYSAINPEAGSCIAVGYIINFYVTAFVIIIVFIIEFFKKDLRIPDKFAKALWYKGYFCFSLMAIAYLWFKYYL